MENGLAIVRPCPQKKEKEATTLFNERDDILREIPNIVDASVPVGTAEKNKVLKIFGKPSAPKFIASTDSLYLRPQNCK